MNNKKLPALAIGATLSMTVLIAIQVYWIRTSAETQQKQFDQTVMEVMNQVTEKLEREEAITTVTSRLFNDYSNDLNQDSVFTLDQFPMNDPFQKELIKRPNKDEAISSRELLNIQFQPPARDSSLFIIRKTQKRVLSSKIDLQSRLKNKSTLVNEIVNELALISVNNNDYAERVSYQQLDSLFKNELKLAGINSPFSFDILDAETQLLSFADDDSDSAKMLVNTPYRISLFPSDFTQSDSLLLHFPNQKSFLLKNMWEVLTLSFVLIVILILLFYSSLSTIFKQKQLSQVKNDFINNMTHELKTPISTISLACEALSDDSISIDATRRSNYIGMITEENKRLSILVDNVLKSAVWDSAQLNLDKRSIKLNEIVEQVANRFKIQIQQRDGSLNLDLKANSDCVIGDEVHLSNVFYNLLDNANKYSESKPNISIKTSNQNGHLVFEIEDHGIGISKEDQKKIFDKFYRVSTGNIHNVKGFGLGLSYVKRIIEMHQGTIELVSKKNSGTTITIKLKYHGK